MNGNIWFNLAAFIGLEIIGYCLSFILGWWYMQLENIRYEKFWQKILSFPWLARKLLVYPTIYVTVFIVDLLPMVCLGFSFYCLALVCLELVSTPNSFLNSTTWLFGVKTGLLLKLAAAVVGWITAGAIVTRGYKAAYNKRVRTEMRRRSNQ